VLYLDDQVYTVALYVEAELAAKELGIRYRGGFFENDDDFCQAIVDGAFTKTMVVSHLQQILNLRWWEVPAGQCTANTSVPAGIGLQ
jgi:hypothetical protein